MKNSRNFAKRVALSSGVTVILDRDVSAPVVSVQAWVETGSEHEGEWLGGGISHALEHMVFKGTRDYGCEEMAQTVQEAGGHWNAYTTFDRTVYYIDGPAVAVDCFLKVLTGLVFFPTLPEEDFTRERDVIRREIDMGLDSASSALSRLLFETVFVEDGRRYPVIGYREKFDRLTIEDLRAYHGARYTAERVFFVISGDFHEEKLLEDLERLTAGVRRGVGMEAVLAHDAPQAGERWAHENFAVHASHGYLMWKLENVSERDGWAFQVLAHVLGEGRSAPLYRKLREEQELALEISASYWHHAQRQSGFFVGFECEVENRDALIDAIEREIATVEITERELARVRRQLSLAQYGSRTSASGRASELGSNWRAHRHLDYTSEFLAGVEGICIEDIQRVQARLHARNLSRILLEPMGTPPPRALQGGMDARAREILPSVWILENGMMCAVIVDERVPVVRFQLRVGGGLQAEPAAVAGRAELLAQLWPHGTKSRSAEELALMLEELGAQFDVAVGALSFSLAMSGLAADFETLFGLFSELVHEPALPADVLERERASLRSSLLERGENPYAAAVDEAKRGFFPNNALGADWCESLELLDVESLRALHRELLVGGNLSLVLTVPNADFESYRKNVERYFGKEARGLRIAACENQTSERKASHLTREKKQAAIVLAYPAPSLLSDEVEACELWCAYANDMAGPLFTRIREELGLCYRIGVFLGATEQQGLLGFHVSTEPGQKDLAMAELRAEIAKFIESGISREALERVKATALSAKALHQQSASFAGQMVSLDLLLGRAPDFSLRAAERLRATDEQAMARFAARYFSLEGEQEIVVQPPDVLE